MNSWRLCFLLLLMSIALSQAHPSITLPEKGQIFEHDILVSNDLQDYVSGSTSKKREYHSSTFKWYKSGRIVKIPYKTEGLDGTISEIVRQSTEVFNGYSCVQFVPRNNEDDYITFKSGSGCSSYVGRKGGNQEIILESGCGILSTVLHEMMHAIGFLHEQARGDRDDFVKVNLKNIQSGKENQFQKYSVQNLGGEYDLYSIMHYKNNEFSKNGLPTIQAKLDKKQTLGNDKFFTKIDIKQINQLYTCDSRYSRLHDVIFTIKTSDEWFAATGATVYLEMMGEGTDTSGEFKAGTGFDGDSTVSIERFFPSMVTKKLSVRHDNKGWGAGWHLDNIKIKDKTTKAVLTFNCDCWIEGTSATFITP